MNILLDGGVPNQLIEHLNAHTVFTTQDRGWDRLKNGELLEVAQHDFDVLITTDSNIDYQQVVARFEIAVLVIRAFNNKIDSYLPIIPELLSTLKDIQHGQLIALYANQKLRESDKRKGKIR